MDREAALKMASILITADRGCAQCVNELLLLAKSKFPEYDWIELAREAIDNEEGQEPA